MLNAPFNKIEFRLKESNVANNCNNCFSVKHSDPAMIERFRKGWDNDGVFNEFIPMPDELRDGASPCRDEALKASNIEKYGAEDWYDWSNKNWGDKRDAGKCNGEIRNYDNGLCGWFESAWGPPIEAFIRLGRLGFKYELEYDECGAGFAGVLSWDGMTLRDDCYGYDFDQLEKDGLDWKNLIPEEFHEVVGNHYDNWLEFHDDDEDDEDADLEIEN